MEQLWGALRKLLQKIAYPLFNHGPVLHPAVHFERAREYERAVLYREQAAQQAMQRYAYGETTSHLSTGLALLKMLPDTPTRAQHELRLHLALGAPLMATKGWAAPELGAAYGQARELCQQAGETTELFLALFGLWVFQYTRVELSTARELAEQLLALARRSNDGTLLMEAHHALGNTLHRLGELPAARTHLEQGLRHYDAMRHHVRSPVYGLDDGVAGLGYAAVVLWSLGYPDQALQRTHEMLTLARGTAQPVNLAWASNTAAWQYQLRREDPQTQEHTEAGMTLCMEYGFAQLLAVGTILRGWALAAQGQKEDGMAQMREGLAAFQDTDAQIGRPRYLTMLAAVYGDMGQSTEGLTLLDEALTVAQHTGERFYEAEFYRLKGELLLQNAECGIQPLTPPLQMWLVYRRI